MGNTNYNPIFEYINLSDLNNNLFLESKYTINSIFKSNCSDTLKYAGLYIDIIKIILDYVIHESYSIIFNMMLPKKINVKKIYWIENKTAISGKLTYHYSYNSFYYNYNYHCLEINLRNHINVIFGNKYKLKFLKSDNINIFDSNTNLIDGHKYKYFYTCNDFLKNKYGNNNEIISRLILIENSDIFEKAIVIDPYFSDELNMFYFKNLNNLHLLSEILKHISFIISKNLECRITEKLTPY